MTPKGAFDAASATTLGERVRRFRAACAARGQCRLQLLDGPTRSMWCGDCLTIYDHHERPINQLPENPW
jgi:hypothetical protein